MSETERLYFRDPYVTEFEADVVGRRDTAEGPAIVLASTYFYPESGGQPHDLGTIDDVPVTRVVEDGETILHVVDRFPERDRVRCVIDAKRRRDHMQQHSGQHILSAAMLKELAAQTLSFHLGSETSTIDLDRPLDEKEIRRAERIANDAVRAARPIRWSFAAAEEASGLELRKPPPSGKTLRIVEVEGFDLQACCGTHPRSSAEVGPIIVRSVEKAKGGARVTFLCGDRAVEDHHRSVARLRSLAEILSSAESDLPELVEKLRDERKALGKELDELRKERWLASVPSWLDELEPVGELRVLVKRLDEAEPSALRAAAGELVREPDRVVLLGATSGDRAHLVFARSSDVHVDVGALLRAAVERLAGRGGGSASFAQGGGPAVAALSEALSLARSKLETT